MDGWQMYMVFFGIAILGVGGISAAIISTMNTFANFDSFCEEGYEGKMRWDGRSVECVNYDSGLFYSLDTRCDDSWGVRSPRNCVVVTRA